MLRDILGTPGCPAALAAFTHAPGFYAQIQKLGMDGLIHPTVLFHDQSAVKHQVWSHGIVMGS